MCFITAYFGRLSVWVLTISQSLKMKRKLNPSINSIHSPCRPCGPFSMELFFGVNNPTPLVPLVKLRAVHGWPKPVVLAHARGNCLGYLLGMSGAHGRTGSRGFQNTQLARWGCAGCVERWDLACDCLLQLSSAR